MIVSPAGTGGSMSLDEFNSGFAEALERVAVVGVPAIAAAITERVDQQHPCDDSIALLRTAFLSFRSALG